MSSKVSAIATLRVFLYRRTAAIIESISDTASESHILDVPSMVAIKASESVSVSVHLISDVKAATLDLSRAVRYPAMMIFILSIGNAMTISLSACDTSRMSASPSLTNSIAI